MANSTLRWTVQPKVIDASSNELNLPQYTSDVVFNQRIEQDVAIAISTTLTANKLGTCYGFELVSDVPVTLTVNSIVFTGVTNVIVNLTTRLTVSTVTIQNASASVIANIIWRMYDNV
jgi:hypothetical protein